MSTSIAGRRRSKLIDIQLLINYYKGAIVKDKNDLVAKILLKRNRVKLKKLLYMGVT